MHVRTRLSAGVRGWGVHTCTVCGVSLWLCACVCLVEVTRVDVEG